MLGHHLFYRSGALYRLSYVVGYDGAEKEREGVVLCEEFGRELGGELDRDALRGVFFFLSNRVAA